MTISNTVNMLIKLKDTSKISDKKELLESIHDETTKRVLSFLADGNQVIGISTKKLNKSGAMTQHDYDIVALLDYLVNHPTGSEVEVGMVRYYLQNLEAQDRAVMSMVITKTWTTTVGASLLNQVYGAGFVPVFDVQLAYPVDKYIHTFDDDKVFVVTQKLDGYRALVEVKDGQVQAIRTRKGKPIEGVTELKQAIEDATRGIKGHMIYDGEVLKEDRQKKLSTVERFQQTSRLVSSKNEAKDLGFHIFDALPYDQFQLGQSLHPYIQRRMSYLHPVSEQQNDFLHVVPVLGTSNKETIVAWSDWAVSKGYEGVMLNDPQAVYQTKRTKSLLKVKAMRTADLPIIGFEEAIDGKNKGGLKSLIVKLDDENEVNVSSGLTEKQREDIWRNQEAYLGKIVEVKYFEETTNQKGGRSLRFPVVMGIRDDKTQEDVNVE